MPDVLQCGGRSRFPRLRRQASKWHLYQIYSRPGRDAHFDPADETASSGPAGHGLPLLASHYQFPKMASFKNAALLSDINAGEGRLKVAHKVGLNVLYNSGAAKWVDLKSSTNLAGTHDTLETLINNDETGFTARLRRGANSDLDDSGCAIIECPIRACPDTLQ